MRTRYFILFFMLLTSSLAAQVTVVPYASSWKYLDNGSDQGTAWRSLSFDDATWKSGSGKFGYGISDASTVISYGPNASNKYVTTYFRKVVNITNPSSYTSFTCNVKRDDGVVVYVNGKEVYRNKMPTGTITYSTWANSGGDKGVLPKTFPINNTFFTSGNNVIAVEIHIEKPTTSIEMAFDLELLGTPSTTPADQTPPIVQSINRQSPTTETTTATTVTYRVAFSEKVVGVHAGDFVATAVSGTVSGTPSSIATVGTDGTTYDVTVNAINGAGSLRLDLQGSGTGITDQAGNAITGGFTTGQSYTIEPIATTAPAVLSINRQLPNTSTTNATSVIYRATFSQGVTGVDAGDFTAITTSGTVTGTPTAVTSVGSDGTTYDITVGSITGTGTLRLDLKDAGTGIANLAGAAISGGFTSGQTYTIAEVVSNAVVSYGASWKYLDDGSNQGTAWQTLSFDEASWKNGNGKFGYGIPDASTVISYGPNATNKYITTYFRKTINISNPAAATIYNAGVKRDDGVVIYVNGKEVFRNKMPSGTPTYTTLAASGGDKGVTPKAFTISPSAFVSGINVIAVEVHVQAANAPSMAFDLEIKGDQPSADQTPPAVTSINRQSPSTATTNASTVVYRVVFSESVQNVDAGDFAISGSGVSGTPFSITAVGIDGTTYDVTVNAISGSGTLKLDLKSTGTGITDAAGNAISGGFTSGESYTITQSEPTLNSVGISSSNSKTSLAKAGDVVTLSFTASEPINLPTVMIATHSVTPVAVSGNSFTAAYTMTTDDAEGVVPFSISFTSAAGSTGTAVTATTNSSLVTFDKTNPVVSSIVRQSPATERTSNTSVTFRASFSENVAGVDINDFSLQAITGALSGTVESVTPVDSATYDVSVSSISGDGVIRLDLNSNGNGITDVAGNAIATGFTAGESYSIEQSAPMLTSVTIMSNNSNQSLAKVGDVVSLQFTASEPINLPTVTIDGNSVEVVAAGANSFTAAYTLTAGDAEGSLPFNISFSNTNGIEGIPVNTTTNGSSVSFDRTAPAVTSIVRQSPATENTSATTVTFRATFSEGVSGVDKGDFTLTVLSGTASGILAENAVNPVGADGTTYDVTVSSITGSGTLRLDVASSSTDIKDMAGNTIMSDYTAGQGYTFEEQTLSYGFASVTPLTPLNISDYTKDKPQAKAWKYAGKWWCVLPTSSGVKIFRLDVKSWVEILNIRATTNARADCRVVGDLVHILLYKGASQSSSLTTAQYDPATGKYKLWPKRTGNVTLIFPAGSETATVVVDSKGRMWAASDGVTDMTVRWSDAPYTTWSAPIVIASGTEDDDICTLVELPSQGKIGLFWSNQETERFGFRTHTDGADPTDWSADEVPASQSAISFKYGMADDHMNIKVASDGTMYCGVKTGYNTVGYPQLSLLIRRPSGTWDNLYEVTSGEGTQPLVVLNEAKGKLKVVYTTEENGGNIMYKESSISNISFGAQVTLISGGGYLYNYSTSTHQTYDPEVVILATQQSTSPMQAVSVLASDEAPVAPTSIQAIVERNVSAEMKASLAAYPNPFSGQATVNFSLEQAGEYSLSLYDMKGTRLAVLKRGRAEADQLNTVRVDGSALSSGFYLVRLETASGTRTLKMILKK